MNKYDYTRKAIAFIEDMIVRDMIMRNTRHLVNSDGEFVGMLDMQLLDGRLYEMLRILKNDLKGGGE